MRYPPPLAEDLDHVLSNTVGVWDDLRESRLFITGGTGFVGSWLLESLAWANEHLGLSASALVLTRDRDAFRNKAPHLADHPAIGFHTGDVRDFSFPPGEFTHVIHAAATSARATFNQEDPLVKFDTVVQGTRRTLDFAVKCRAKKLLFTSSGAVYGRPPSDLTHIPEEYCGAPDPSSVRSAWGEAKRAAEFLCAYYSAEFGVETKIARCFSFVGPYLELDIHYAIGNFINDAINGGPVLVRGDGRPWRSYLYAADMVIWLWKILTHGSSSLPYNVGSEAGLAIAELARVVARLAGPGIECTVSTSSVDPSAAIDRYVPSTRRARTGLRLEQTIGLEQAIQRTMAFLRSR